MKITSVEEVYSDSVLIITWQLTRMVQMMAKEKRGWVRTLIAILRNKWLDSLAVSYLIFGLSQQIVLELDSQARKLIGHVDEFD